MNRKYWTLLAVASAGDKGLTPAQLQKSLFLLQQVFGEKLSNYYSFEPYNYGPFDNCIYNDAEILAAEGLLIIKEQPGRSWSWYYISEKGKEKTEKLLVGKADSPIVKYLAKLTSWAQKLSFQQLIAAIYTKYPSYRVNSVFKD